LVIKNCLSIPFLLFCRKNDKSWADYAFYSFFEILKNILILFGGRFGYAEITYGRRYGNSI
tara:strand:+ start:301 stop:483 length:183 start_codon:yes stop_codon:yes gene_type:complete